MSFQDIGTGRQPCRSRNGVGRTEYAKTTLMADSGAKRFFRDNGCDSIVGAGGNDARTVVTASSSGSRGGTDESFGSHDDPSSNEFSRKEISSQHNRPVCLTRNGERYNCGLLSEDIFRFQKMVSDLKQYQCISPANQWRTLVDSTEELGALIEHQLTSQWNNIEHMEEKRAVNMRASLTKLQRDFRRTRATYTEVTSEIQKRKFCHDDLSSAGLTEANENSNPAQCGQGQMQSVVEREEDYAQYVMREREEEMHQINTKVHKVNEIYKDLGYLVSSQQEQFDKLEENLDTSNEYAKRGLEQIEEANCPSRWSQPFQQNQALESDVVAAKKDGSLKGECAANAFSFGWPKQFESLKDDMDDMHKDITALGTDLMRKGKLMMLGCTAMGDVSGSAIL